jgi:hypothetical protein
MVRRRPREARFCECEERSNYESMITYQQEHPSQLVQLQLEQCPSPFILMVGVF